MNEIDQLLKISNNGHSHLNGAAKFWVLLTWLSCGFAGLILIVLVLAALFLK